MEPHRPHGPEEEFERKTEAKSQLVPPGRRPPTAVGTGTPVPPPRPPASDVLVRRRPLLWRVLRRARQVAGAVLDLADAAAEAFAKRAARGV